MVEHFGDAAAELGAAFESCVLLDRSDLSRLVARGPDILSLLHRLSTADLQSLRPGEGRPTVLTSPKGRIIELARAVMQAADELSTELGYSNSSPRRKRAVS